MRWVKAQIAKTCLRTRMQDPRRNPNKSFIYVDISTIDRDLKIITSAPEIIGSEAPSRARKEIREGDILVSTVRPNLNAVAVVPPELDGQIASTGFCVLRPNKSAIVGKYLFFFTTTPYFVGILNGKVRGAHYPAVSDGDVKEIELPLPTIPEQHRIVKIIDQAEALRKKRAEADVKAARILTALFYKMFGDPATNPKGWDICSLGEVIKDTRNGLYKPAEFFGRGIPILKMFNILDGELDLRRVDLIQVDSLESKDYGLLPGDILMNRVNTPELVGKCAVITENLGTSVFESKNIRIRLKPDRVTSEYIASYLNSTFGHGALRSGVKHAIGMATINNSDLRSLCVPVPPFSLQQKWGEIIRIFRNHKRKSFASYTGINSLFMNLLHSAFAGDLTAKWREAHMKELLVEMEHQAKTLDCPSTKSTPPEVGSTRHAGHDMFNKAALAAYITDRCHAPDRPMGRVKLAKLFYLVQQKAEIELTETFVKRAAGPLDDEIHKFLSLAQKSKWLVLCRGEGGLKPVKPGANVSKAIEQAQKLLGSAKARVDEMLDQMKGWGYRTLERWATVLDASFELTANGQPATFEGVKDVIQKHPEWVPKLNRDEFSDMNIEATLRGLRSFGFITNQD